MTELDDLGQLLFEHEYDFADGLGGGASATSPKGPFRRVHAGDFGGPETISSRVGLRRSVKPPSSTAELEAAPGEDRVAIEMRRITEQLREQGRR